MGIGTRDSIADGARHGKLDFRKKPVTDEKSAPPPCGRTLENQVESLLEAFCLLLVAHFRGGCRVDFLELRKWPETGWFDVTGAAAGSGQKRESGNNECGDDANHGIGCGRC